MRGIDDQRPILTGYVPGTYARVLDEYLLCQGETSLAALPQVPERMPIEQWRERLHAAVIALQDPLLGLHLGQTVKPAHFGIYGYLFHASENLGAVLQRLQRYHRLVYDMNPLSVRFGNERVYLSWGTEQGVPGPHVDECAITALVTLASSMLGRAFVMHEVSYVNAEPERKQWRREFHQAYGCPVRFNASATQVVLPVAELQAPLVNPDPAMRRIFSEAAESQLAEFRDDAPVVRAVVRTLAAELADSVPTQTTVAKALAMSARSLHRKLQRAGWNFRDLLARVRLDMANRYLADAELSLSEVAFLCGYSEQSAFSRAYKSWTGRSPKQARSSADSL